MNKKLQTNSPEETEKIAQKIAGNLKGGEIIELISDLGGGKTTFVHGLARGVSSQDKVSSPTFTISKIYKGRLDIHHFDFYRLDDPGVIKHEIDEVMNDNDVVVVIEWPGIVNGILPKNKITINFINTGENQRTLEVKYPSDMTYLINDVNT